MVTAGLTGGHSRITAQLRSAYNRQMIDEALHRVWKWRAEGKLDPRYADEWERVSYGVRGGCSSCR